MTTARAVIGASFGDEGKGLVTDYLCAQGAGMVVRYNGGAQAGHTVVTPEGVRHVFGHFGAGSLLEVPTYLSKFFVCNPLSFLKERDRLAALDVYPKVYAHPDCLVTTFADMIINQQLEDARGAARHGSVGLGINETILRSTLPELKITVADLWNGGARLPQQLEESCDRYARFRTGKAIPHPEEMSEAFLTACEMFAEAVHPLGIEQCRDPVFEGAQGLLLDQDNKEFYPHVTRSKTGVHNVRLLCAQAGIDRLEAYYVSRTYLTRHGAGPLPGEDAALSYADETNVDHPYQGRLRFAPLDCDALLKRCAADCGAADFKLALTHCDQKDPPVEADYYFHGESRDDVFTREGTTCSSA